MAEHREDWSSMDDVGFAALVGPLEQDSSDPDVGRFRLATRPEHANRNGYVHGGLLMTVADHGMGLHARRGDMGLAHATVSFTMQFVAAVEPGAVLELECRIVRARRTVVFVDGIIRDGDEVVANCTGVWRRFDKG